MRLAASWVVVVCRTAPLVCQEEEVEEEEEEEEEGEEEAEEAEEAGIIQCLRLQYHHCNQQTTKQAESGTLFPQGSNPLLSFVQTQVR